MKTAVTFAVAGLLASLFSISSFAQESHWKLTAIKTSIMPLAPMIRETKELPLDIRTRRDVMWSSSADKGPLKITADVRFAAVPEMISVGNTFINLDFIIVAGGTTPFADYIIFKTVAYLETVSGFQQKDFTEFLEQRVENNEQKTIDCGVRIINTIPKEDFTLTLHLYVNFGGRGSNRLAYERDVTYYLSYKWMGETSVAASGCFSADPTAAVATRDVHFNWAEKQEPYILDQNLANKLQMLFDCKGMNDAKIHNLFGDLSVIVAKYASAECFPDDAGAAVHDRAAHMNWASTQTRAVLYKNLYNKLEDAFMCLRRTQQNSFFADISVIMANAAR